MPQLEAAARIPNADDVGTRGVACVDAAGDDEQSLAGRHLELAPQRVRPAHERNVIGMFPVREADDAALTVRRSELVRDVELFERQHARAARGQMIGGRAAHAADTDDDDVMHLYPTLG